MPKTLLGRVAYLFIGTAACTTMFLCGLATWNEAICQMKESEEGKEDAYENYSEDSDGSNR